jgi:hypothetical protein
MAGKVMDDPRIILAIPGLPDTPLLGVVPRSLWLHPAEAALFYPVRKDSSSVEGALLIKAFEMNIQAAALQLDHRPDSFF